MKKTPNFVLLLARKEVPGGNQYRIRLPSRTKTY